MSAPVPLNLNPYWINPNNFTNLTREDLELLYEGIGEIYEEIINDSNICYKQSKVVKEKLLERLEGTSEDSYNGHYLWLKVPQLSENLETVDRNEAIKEIYFTLQTFAIAIEQIIEDQSGEGNEDKLEFVEIFIDAKLKLIQLLCSLQTSLVWLDIQPLEDPTEDIMNIEFRILENSRKRIRDFIVFRDYHSTVSYTKELIKYFLSH